MLRASLLAARSGVGLSAKPQLCSVLAGVLHTEGPHREDHLPSLSSQAPGQVTVSEIPTKM